MHAELSRAYHCAVLVSALEISPSSDRPVVLAKWLVVLDTDPPPRLEVSQACKYVIRNMNVCLRMHLHLHLHLRLRFELLGSHSYFMKDRIYSHSNVHPVYPLGCIRLMSNVSPLFALALAEESVALPEESMAVTEESVVRATYQQT
jgi:hypothetical protein